MAQIKNNMPLVALKSKMVEWFFPDGEFFFKWFFNLATCDSQTVWKGDWRIDLDCLLAGESTCLFMSPTKKSHLFIHLSNLYLSHTK